MWCCDLPSVVCAPCRKHKATVVRSAVAGALAAAVVCAISERGEDVCESEGLSNEGVYKRERLTGKEGPILSMTTRP